VDDQLQCSVHRGSSSLRVSQEWWTWSTDRYNQQVWFDRQVWWTSRMDRYDSKVWLLSLTAMTGMMNRFN